MTARVRRITDKGALYGHMIECPGCGAAHVFDTRWTFDGNMDFPTFTPSLHVRFPDGKVCHSFVTAGKIKFLPDSTHALAGQTVELGDA